MEHYRIIQWGGSLTALGFFFAFGAVCGSFINVLVYRLPRGLNIITPPSACPACGTPLTWRENLPIIGWMLLRGRCRFCRTRISAEYPLVEFLVAMLFAGLFALWLMDPSVFGDTRAWAPEWARAGLQRMWPMFALVLLLVGALVTATLIDARTFTIPLLIPWTLIVAAVVVHPAHALWYTLDERGRWLTDFPWTIPAPDAGWLGVALGGALGLVVSIALLRARVLPQSFADYEEWERSLPAPSADTGDAAGGEPGLGDRKSPRDTLLRALLLTGPGLALMFLGFALGMSLGLPVQGAAVGLGAGLLAGLVLRRVLGSGGDGASEEPVWAGYPHVRHEMGKEVLFCLPILALGVAGWWVGQGLGTDAPLWLRALGGSLMGLLAGGGVVWVTRIAGSLVFGKEAMGLGDVHLMAGVGAVTGWIDPVLAFFIAPFLGIGWAVLSVVFSGLFKRQGTALPYGPHLAAATLMVVTLKPVFEGVLSGILRQPVNLP